MKLIGSAAFNDNHWLSSLYNDALGQVLWNETNETLRIVIALLGLQYSGVRYTSQASIPESKQKLIYSLFHIYLDGITGKYKKIT